MTAPRRRPVVERGTGWISYARVSTQAQAGNTSIANQHAEIDAWAKTKGIDIVDHVHDVASGSLDGFASRVEFAQVLHQVAEGTIAGFVVLRLDRMSRDLVLQERIIDQVMRRHGGQIAVVNEAEHALLRGPGDGDGTIDDASRTMMRQIFAAIFAYERAILRARAIAGQRRAKDSGIPSGRTPFGFRRDQVTRQFVPVEPEYTLLREVVALRGIGIPYSALATYLMERGARSLRPDGTWSATLVAQMAQRAVDRGLAQPMPYEQLSGTARLFAGLPEVRQ